MSKPVVLSFYFLGVFLQAGTYGLTFMLPKLFETFGANEKDVGVMLLITTIVTLVTAYYGGHIADRLGRMPTLALSGVAIAGALFLFGTIGGLGAPLAIACILLGFGWSLFYALGPVVLSRITAPRERVRAFSLHSVFVMAGFGLAPVMASAMEHAGFAVADAFIVMAFACLVSSTVFFLLTGPVRALSAQEPAEEKSRLTLANIGQVLRSRARIPVLMVLLGASIFAGLNNFQTVFAEARGLPYADFFLIYTITVVICRIMLAGFSGGKHPYGVIAALQYIMCASIVLFLMSGTSQPLYMLVAILFGIGYGASYPILVAMAANDANDDLVPQTLQLFAFSYFFGIFGFPLVAGWVIVEYGVPPLLIGIAIMAAIEATLAASRYLART